MEEIVQFVPMEKELMKLVEVRLVGNPDKLLRMTPTSKLLYRYMWDRYKHFEMLGKKFFDNQDNIAEAMGVTSRTVLNLIKDMVEFGLVQKTATKTIGAAHSNSYVVLDIFDKSQFITNSTGKLYDKYANKSEYKSVVTKPSTKVNINYEDDPDVPF